MAPSFRFPGQRTARAKVHDLTRVQIDRRAPRVRIAMRHEQPQTDPQSRVPRRRARHALPARDQGDSQGAAADRRPAADPVRGRRGARGGDRADDLRHRPRQDRARRAFRHGLRARDDDGRARQGPVDPRCHAHSRRATSITVRQQVPLGPRPRDLVRARDRRRRAVRDPAARRADGRHARLHGADGRGLRGGRRQPDLGARGAARGSLELRRDRSRRERTAR